MPFCGSLVEWVQLCLLIQLFSVHKHKFYTHSHKHTHTLLAVPFCVHGEGCKLGVITHDPGLSDVAPTVLAIMGVEAPPEMNGQSLLAH